LQKKGPSEPSIGPASTSIEASGAVPLDEEQATAMQRAKSAATRGKRQSTSAP
jgi:hypothetical protein